MTNDELAALSQALEAREAASAARLAAMTTHKKVGLVAVRRAHRVAKRLGNGADYESINRDSLLNDTDLHQVPGKHKNKKAYRKLLRVMAYAEQRKLVKALRGGEIEMVGEDPSHKYTIPNICSWKTDGISAQKKGMEVWMVKHFKDNVSFEVTESLSSIENDYGKFKDPSGNMLDRDAAGVGLFLTLLHMGHRGYV